MDTLRGNFADRADLDEADGDHRAEEAAAREGPPPEIGQDERRMQVRAYNHWAGLLEGRNFPSIDDLEPENLPDFGPYSVLLDFTSGIEDPGVSFLGEELAAECGADTEISRLSDVPSRSLLSRITDHYMQILANQAPIGFEAEFVNQRGVTILYRGILLPFSSDDDTIDFIYGVINWKELADQQTTDELMLEIDQALDEAPDELPEQRELDAPMTDWADGPAASVPPFEPREAPIAGPGAQESPWSAAGAGMPAPSFGEAEPEAGWPAAETEIPAPSFGGAEFVGTSDTIEEIEIDSAMELGEEFELHEEVGFEAAPGGYDEGFAAEREPDEASVEDPESEYGEEPAEAGAAGYASLTGAASAPQVREPAEWQVEPEAPYTEIELPEIDESEMELGDWLASARELAMAARTSEDRTRAALYEAISRAYDFSLAAAEAPEEFAEIVADSGLTMQDRAPMTPVVKLVFGADYDKTRLTEYASALTHAHRIGLGRGRLGEYLRAAEGGLKGVVAAERRLRREEAGKPVEAIEAPRERLARKLRRIAPMGFDAIPAEGREFGLVMIRRLESGAVVVLGEVPDDVALVERAARKLLG